jgi:sodium/bile acid cotransporter 7
LDPFNACQSGHFFTQGQLEDVILFLKRRWFLIALAAVLAIGMGFAPWLQPLSKLPGLRHLIVALVLFIMALPLEASMMLATVRRPTAALLATSINFGLLPLTMWGTVICLQQANFLQGDLGESLAIGLLVVAATPCTLASASVWTRKAGGNDAIAIMVTVITNLSCFIISPCWLLLTANRNVDLELGAMIIKLGLLVVLPMTVAQLLRIHQPLARWATGKKTQLSILSQCGILTMVFLGSIMTGNNLRQTPIGLAGLGSFTWMIITVLTIHTAMFVIGFKASKWSRLSRPDATAVGFSGSQKTLIVGLTMAVEAGGSILPMISYHVGQLLIDTLIADRLKRTADQQEQPAPPREGV